jgi:triacylglycerol lipase
VNPVDYALLSKRAYTDAPTIGEANSASRMHVYGDVHVFRGTDDFMAAIADAQCATTRVWGLGEIHAGFYAALAAILPACLSLPRPVAITGHSLGAAMAIIYAAVLAQMGCVVPVYAFEPPRLCFGIAMSALFKNFQVPFYATRNGLDLVTQIPSGLTLPGTLTLIGRPAMPLDNFTDHSIDRVIAALGA